MSGGDEQVGRPGTSGRGRAAAGLAAGAIALALLWALSRIEPRFVFPPLALAELVIRSTPGDVATFFIEQIGKWAIRSLAIGMTLAFLAASALLAWQSGRIRSAAASIVAPSAAVGLILFAAAFGANVRPSTGAAIAVAAIGAAAYGFALALISLSIPGRIEREANLDRRAVLLGATSMALGLALGGTLLGRLLKSEPTAPAIAAPPKPPRTPSRAPFPDVRGLSPETTPVAEHYVVDINLTKPEIDPGAWSLTVEGLVDQPLEVSFDDLQAGFELVEQQSVLTCISNEVGGPLIGNSVWTGVSLAEVLERAGLQAGARDLLLTGADGYTVTIPPAVATSRLAMLAIAQNGEPLSVEHGAPCRLRVPQLYGMMNCKWLERIEAIDADEEGYWAQRGWSDTGVVQTQSKFDTVDPLPAAGATSWIAGVAWAGDRGISRVEVSTDGGESWRRALLREPLGAAAWTQWAFEWSPQRSGIARLAVRAADGTGEVQTEELAQPHPDGATGYHRIEVEVS